MSVTEIKKSISHERFQNTGIYSLLYQRIYLRTETQLVSIILTLKHPGSFSIQGCMSGLSRAIWRKMITFLLCYTAILLCKLVFKLLPTHYSFGCQYQMCLCQLCFSLLFLRGICLHFSIARSQDLNKFMLQT